MSDSNNTIPDGFRVITGYPRYAIDENGTILSVCSRGRGKDKLWINATRIKLQKDKDGYCVVCFCSDGAKKTIKVHHMVLLTFSGECPEGMECRHLDGNQVNNHVSNLAWGTKTENGNDRVLHETMPRGKNHHKVKLTEEDVLAIRTRAENGESQMSIAKCFSMAQSTIWAIIARRIWKHI